LSDEPRLEKRNSDNASQIVPYVFGTGDSSSSASFPHPFLVHLHVMSVPFPSSSVEETLVEVHCGDYYGCPGFRDAQGTKAMFNVPSDLLWDKDGSILISDSLNYCIRRVTADGVVTTVAGSPEDSTLLGSPTCMYSIPEGLLVGDMDDCSLRLVNVNGGVSVYSDLEVASSAERPADAAVRVRCPVSLLSIDTGLLVCDNHGHCIVHLDELGVVTLWAGTGVAGYRNGGLSGAQLNMPQYLLALPSEGLIIVSDFRNGCLRAVNPVTETIDDYAGVPCSTGHAKDGFRTWATFIGPDKTILLPSGNIVISDMSGSSIRMLDTQGWVTTLAGNGQRSFRHGEALSTMWRFPCGLVFDPLDGQLFVSDSENHCVRKFKLKETGARARFFQRPPVTATGGSGVGASSRLSFASIYNDPTLSTHDITLLGRTWHLHKSIIRIRLPSLLTGVCIARLEQVLLDMSSSSSSLSSSSPESSQSTDSNHKEHPYFPAIESIFHWMYTDCVPYHDVKLLMQMVRLIDVISPSSTHETHDANEFFANEEEYDLEEYADVVHQPPLTALVLINLEAHWHSACLESANSLMPRAKLVSSLFEMSKMAEGLRECILLRHVIVKDASEKPFPNSDSVSNFNHTWADYENAMRESFANEALFTEWKGSPLSSGMALLDEHCIYRPIVTLSDSMDLEVTRLSSANDSAQHEWGNDDANFRLLHAPRAVRDPSTMMLHREILASRWPYFRRAMDFGGTEHARAEMDLSESFGSDVLNMLIKFLYTGLVVSGFIHNTNIGDFWDNCVQFGFVDDQLRAKDEFREFVDAFVLHDLDSSGNPSNLIPSYHRSQEIGTEADKTMTIANLTNQFASVLELHPDTAKQQLATLSDKDFKRILMLQFGRGEYTTCDTRCLDRYHPPLDFIRG